MNHVTPADAPRKALVIGAGIGGLAAGIALQQAGLAVEVFEQADEPRDAGAAISLWTNAIHAVDVLGLRDAVRSSSFTYSAGCLRSWNGLVLASMPVAELQRRFGRTVIVIQRSDLFAALLKALGKQHLNTGRRCVRVRQDGQGVAVDFADGGGARGDLLIGADGLHSAVRAHLHGAEPLRYSGCTAWRAVVSFDTRKVVAGESWGYGSVFGQVPMSDNRCYWYGTKNTAEGQTSGNEKADLLRLFGRWHAPIQALIEAADERRILRNDIYDRPVLDSWGTGRITLLGDAAHPMMPFLGQGGCQALEDAVVLGKCLAEPLDVEPALREYERRRISRANMFVTMSRRVGWIAQLQNPLAVRLRNAAVRRIPRGAQLRQLERLISHKV